jgi:hypothetical protein
MERGSGAVCSDAAVWRGCPGQKTFDRKIFVDIGPVNTEARSSYLPVRALLGSCMEQARIPGQRHTDRSPILQVHDEKVLSAMNIANARASFRF